jgi:hypothetical protein
VRFEHASGVIGSDARVQLAEQRTDVAARARAPQGEQRGDQVFHRKQGQQQRGHGQRPGRAAAGAGDARQVHCCDGTRKRQRRQQKQHEPICERVFS